MQWVIALQAINCSVLLCKIRINFICREQSFATLCQHPSHDPKATLPHHHPLKFEACLKLMRLHP